MNQFTNVEIKSRCVSQENIEKLLLELGAVFKGTDHQIDTYFNTVNGRLKLRQGNIENSLIFYDRSDDANSRESNIILERLSGDNKICEILAASIGTKIIVDKKRKIFFIDNVKFHVDEVLGLGHFVEIEAIDHDGTFTKEKLKEQCDHYIEILGLVQKDYMDLSYSDLVVEPVDVKIYREAHKFLNLLEKSICKIKFPVDWNALDHLCYRVTSSDEYKETQRELGLLGELLIESKVGGRSIATYKLKKPIKFKGNDIYILELPMPKDKNKYATGFEHAEFVIKESFSDIISKYSEIDFDESAAKKEVNPDIRIVFESGQSIKLHHQSLEDVIKYEKSVI